MLAFLGFGESPLALFILAGIVLLLFGNRLPEVMRSMGKGISEFKRGLKDIEEDFHKELPRNETSVPRSEASRSEAPRAEVPRSEAPRAEAPHADTPQDTPH